MNQHDWFETRWGIRLPDGTMATTWQGQIWSWDSRENAERAMEYFKAYSAKLGVADWNGEIVRQLCTPWISDSDDAGQLVEELSAWLARETGGQP